AMPDGRFAGEPFGNTMGPRPGADREGVTAMLNSVAKLPLEKGVGGTTLNLVLTSRLLESREMRQNVAALIRTFLKSGGQMIQVTTANVEDLQDAVVHPENHGDLIVRIGGFSIQFVQLGQEAQQEIIRRYQTAG
ncbi:MAG: pyruvate formate lyase, partial [Clostridia bacterium]|nr:pyruvate formate lyase [Clostridia bacterium]